MGGPNYKTIRVPHPVTGERIKILLHEYLWLVANGFWKKGQTSTPDGYELHHVDFNPFNNDLSNLRLVTHSEHVTIHWQIDRDAKIERFKARMAAITPEKLAERIAKTSESLKAFNASLTDEERKARMAKIRIYHQKLTEDDVRYIRANYKKRDRGGVGKLCAKFDISASHIRQIVSRRLFPNVN